MQTGRLKKISEMLEKYSLALCTILYPNQSRALCEALERYSETGEIETIEDSFVNLALMMILCDLHHQERTQEGGTE